MIFTTNNIGSLSPRLIRSGRITLKLEITDPHDVKQLHRYIDYRSKSNTIINENSNKLKDLCYKLESKLSMAEFEARLDSIFSDTDINDNLFK
jgi:ATP-dependent 26S proteasome regulatory subunit